MSSHKQEQRLSHDPSDAVPNNAPTYDEATARLSNPTYTYMKSFANQASTLRLSLISERVIGNQLASGAVPVYFDGSVIRGTASLTDVVKVSLREISVNIRGRVRPSVSSYSNQANRTPVVPNLTFLTLDTVLWSCDGRSGSRKLEGPGPHSWSFAIPLPATVRVGPTEYPLPPTYNDKARIEYTVEVVVKRGSVFSSDVTSVFEFLADDAWSSTCFTW